jgi:hypothetical protein
MEIANCLSGRRRGVVAASFALLTLVAIGVRPTSAGAAAGPDRGSGTFRTTLNIPSLVLTNDCNGDVVNLSGKLHVSTKITVSRDGGYTVRSAAAVRDLRGTRIAPAPAIAYYGADGDNAFSSYDAPANPSTHRVTHWSRLVSQGAVANMFLNLVLRETIAADGTVLTVFERADVDCRQPNSLQQHSGGPAD